MSPSFPFRRAAAVALGALLLTSVGCAYKAPPRHARPSLLGAIPAPLLASPAPAELLEISEWRADDGTRRARGVLAAGDERVQFELHRSGGPPLPLVLLVPILAGGAELMDLVAARLVALGFDVAFCARAGSALTPPQRGPDLEVLFRRTVLHQRLLLGYVRSLPDAPPGIHVLGLSMGGMVSTVVAALEPEALGVAICLSGGDLADLVLTSSEARVRRWLEFRRSVDGIGDDPLRQELRERLRHEPLRFAAAVATERVLFVSARFDSVVPRRHQDLLWEALGRPARIDVPLGHYSAALVLDFVLQATADHFRAVAARR